jgi:cytoskeletal protein CcmA (bactofilin family)
MWKSRSTKTLPISPTPEQLRPAKSLSPLRLAAGSAELASHQNMIGKSMIVKGEITGSEFLFIDGSVEGSIHFPGNHVTVGTNGQITASITAGDVVVLGKVCGNIAASNRVDIRAEGAVTGDVTCARLRIEDGAYLKGRIAIRKGGAEGLALVEQDANVPELPAPLRLLRPEGRKLPLRAISQPA